MSRSPTETFLALPLPENWTSGLAHNGKRWVFIAAPGAGAVTVDLEHRAIRPGLYATYGRAIDDRTYTGRGWVERIHADAVHSLLEGYLR